MLGTHSIIASFFQGVLRGEHALFSLYLPNNFDAADQQKMRNYVLARGFTRSFAHYHSIKVEEEPKKGFDADEFIVFIEPGRVQLLADYAIYRGPLTSRFYRDQAFPGMLYI